MTTTGRIALVAGANKGIGLAIARQLAQAGVRVVMGARDGTRGHAAAAVLAAEGLAAPVLALDLDDEGSVSRAAERVGAEHGRLDVLVNNAGLFDCADGPPSTASLAAVRRVMDTTFLGALAVTQAMLPLLRAAPSGRIVNVSSSLGSLGLSADPASPYRSQRFIGHNASKAALNMLTVQLARELRGLGIVVNSVSPGFVRTDLTGAGTMTPEDGALLPVRYALGGPELDGETGRFVEPDGETPW